MRGFSALRLKFSGSAQLGYFQEIVPFDLHVLDIEFHDVCGVSADKQSRYINSILYRDTVEWDWDRRGMYRFVVVKVSEQKYRLVISLQQMAVDRESIILVINSLRSTVLDAANGDVPVVPEDRYESVVAGARLTSRVGAAAKLYWQREFDLPADAFNDNSDIPAARLRTHIVAIEGAAYINLKQTVAAGSWGPAALFLDRLATVWQRYRPRATLVDAVCTFRSAELANQVGMFSTIRPIVMDLGGNSWHDRIAGQLIRASAYQQFDSSELRSIEQRSAVPQRPFPVFNYIGAVGTGPKSEKFDVVSTTRFSPSNTMARPILVKIRDIGDAFAITVQTNYAKFSAEESQNIVGELIGQ
ncbi:hypothetical protein GCM10027088_15450 [Nocardia goodfellowii]